MLVKDLEGDASTLIRSENLPMFPRHPLPGSRCLDVLDGLHRRILDVLVIYR